MIISPLMNSRTLKDKAILRELMLAKRKTLYPKQKRNYDQDICDRLKELILHRKPRVVHSYLPIKREVDVTPLLKWLMDHNLKVVCPKVLPKRQLENLELLHFNAFDIGPFNTLHPAGNVVYTGTIDLVIMPGLAFDKGLGRLGYGGGYYDRFLAKHPNAYKAAVLYPFQLVGQVPVELHDVKMDELIISDLPIDRPF